MDYDLSPNAPPQGIENTTQQFAQATISEAAPIPPSNSNSDSNQGSIDSTGFEKIEPPSEDVLEAYSQNFANQMQQSLFGALPDDPSDNGDEQSLMTTRHDDVLEKSYSDLVDIPANIENPEQVKDVAHNLLGDFHQPPSKPVEPKKDGFDDLLGDFGAPLHSEPSPREEFGDVVESKYAHLQKTEDILSNVLHEQQSKEEHKESVPEPRNVSALQDLTVTEILSRAKEDTKRFENDDVIAEQIDNVHGDVDAIMNRMRDSDDWANEDHPTSPSADSGRDVVGKMLGEEDDSPQFGRQTPEEGTYERQGPLTIPELPENIPDDNDTHSPDHQHHGFETEPRPPTPPKDISEEDVKPSVVNLGPAPPHYHGPKAQHSILKSAPWFDFKTIDPNLLDLIYWRDLKKSAVALSLTLVVLFILATYSILGVLSYTSLLVLAGTVGFRVFKAVEAQIKKTDQQNPFQSLLEQNITLPQEKVHEQVDVLVEHGQLLANQLRRLFLVENIVDSVKFGVLLWSLTYVSAWFSGFGLIIIAVLAVFSIPKFYEVYQEPIDAHVGLIKGQLDNVCKIIEEKLPFLKRTPTAELEKKDQ